MVGYIIGVVLGVIIFLLQNFKPTSIGFRIAFLILTIAFIWGISYAQLGYWNILVIPVGVFVLCFLAAFCFPYGGNSAKQEYMAINGQNYYKELQNGDQIGRIDVPGFKQTYDRILSGIIFQIATSEKDFQSLGEALYSKNFYPISIHTKDEIIQHIRWAIEKVANSSTDGNSIRSKAEDKIESIFNAYVSVMSIHEEATRNLEQLHQRDVTFDEGN